jgi:PAS domain S-box-containing protein
LSLENFEHDKRLLEDDDFNVNVRLLVESQQVAHIGVWQWTLGEEVKWSGELFRIYGVTPSQYKPSYEGYLQKIHPDDRPRIRFILEEAIREVKSFSQDEKIVRPDGSIRHLRTWGHPVTNQEGKLIRYLGVCQDITDRVKAEEELRQSEQRYRNIVQSAQDGIWLIDDQGVTQFVNERMAQILDYASSEMAGQHIFKFIDASQRALVTQLLQSSREKQKHFDLPLRKKDGSRAWTIFAANPLVDDNGKRTGAMAVVTDQTQRKYDQVILSSLRDVVNLLLGGSDIHEVLTVLVKAIENIIEGVTASVLLLDEEGKHILTGSAPGLPEAYNKSIEGSEIGPNAGSCGTSAYTRRLVIAEDIQTDPRWVDYRDLALKHGLRACWSHPVFSYDGKVLGTFAMYFRERRKPTQDEINLVEKASTAAALTIQHVKLREDQQRILTEEKKLKDAAEKSVQQRDDFISIASHELRTPLTPLNLQLELIDHLISEFNNDDKVKELHKMVAGAKKQVSELSQLAENLLHVTHISADYLSLSRQNCKLSDIIYNSISQERDGVEEASCTTSVIIKKDVIGNWDRSQLEQVFSHLISNAAKFGSGHPIEIEIGEEDGSGYVTITDHGIGILKTDQSRLFKKFERITSFRKYGGLGIGLYIANEIVKAHGGQIGVLSEFGKGATFKVVLPVK